ncbi:MAG: DNA translocase FtsK [Firmicutes bacterium]|nr:DNA translocase FtsK [Bacillota bacterium]
MPPPELIEPGLNLRNPRMNKDLTENIRVLESTLDSFGVRATVTQVVAGPAVIRYELQPAPGVKVSRITSLADDIALSLAAPGVRIEAPIPGKSAIGIEVARKETETVYFREMIDSDEFHDAKPKLSFALGKNIGGEYIVGNLAKMPHLLIAGATGSGKSICINTIICSILFKATPDEVKLMLIDPKKVEMTQYARLPHLIAPVVNDSKKAANALKWVVNEMENRYTLFAGAACKDFEGYNRQCPETPLPHIVVIIDELADLMMVAKHDVEDAICRIAQMARAAGIHLEVATQRPSVDVITGLIKANIPSRIAFAVSSYTDSRTILDMGGAEKLLGKGDMLYSPIGMNKPMRVQGTFISEEDVARLVEYCCDQAAPKFSDEAVAAADKEVGESGSSVDEDLDELLYDAAMIIASTGQASVSFLQRRLSIGNPRAARIMDQLEMKGVVGGSKGAKPRDILMSPDEIEQLLG